MWLQREWVVVVVDSRLCLMALTELFGTLFNWVSLSLLEEAHSGDWM